jgi:hypothetical protein
MKTSTLLLLFIVQANFTEILCAPGVRGNDSKERELLELNDIPERKTPPQNFAAKQALKLQRENTYQANQFIVSNLTPTRKPTTWAPTNAPTDTPSLPPINPPTTNPTPAPTRRPTDSLSIVGDDGNPGNVFPLKVCQGDCDSDAECEGNLKCAQRSGLEEVPGCKGQGVSGKDYCADMSMTREPTQKPTETAQGYGLGDPRYRFQMRLYWSIDYFWQETTKETWWCFECTVRIFGRMLMKFFRH